MMTKEEFLKEIEGYSVDELELIYETQKDLYTEEEMTLIKTQLELYEKEEKEKIKKMLPKEINCSKCDGPNSFKNEICVFCGAKLDKKKYYSLEYYDSQGADMESETGEESNTFSVDVSNSIEEVQKKENNTCSILAIIFGAIGIIPLLNILFLPAAVILGIIGVFTSENKKKGVVIASVIVVVISLIVSFIGLGDILSGKPIINTADTSEISQIVSEPVVEEQYEYLSFPETVTTDYFEIYIEGVSISKEIRPKYRSGAYSYKSADKGKQFCYIEGTIKNISGNSHEVSFLGDYIFDDTYNYDGILLKDVENGVDTVLLGETIQPLEKVDFYYACSIPDELINSYSSAEVKFEIITDLYGDYNETKYNRYSLGFVR